MSKKTRLYNIWCGMKKRCYNANSKNYPNYGGRGITVCDEWLNDFSAFESWSVNNGYSDILTIDRIDNDGNYSPNNCRWISHAEQQRNRSNNIRVEHNGNSKTISEIARELGISNKLLYSRYQSAIKHKGCCDYADLLKTPSYKRIYTERYKARKPKPSRIVNRYSIDGEYIDSLSLIDAESMGFNRTAIQNCCGGRAKTSGGYIWRYPE